MPDNLEILDGHGDIQVSATDQVGTAHVSKIKIMNGEADSGIMILAGEGAVENALRIVLAGDKVVVPYSGPDNLVSGVSADIENTIPVQLIAAQGAGIKIYITSITVTNNSASVNTVVKFRDGSGGTVKFRNNAAKDGGGFSVQLPTPIVFSANTAVFVECETTGANVQVSISGYKGG
jgi:hypothetical protein